MALGRTTHGVSGEDSTAGTEASARRTLSEGGTNPNVARISERPLLVGRADLSDA
jgi:hypothetical protein